MWIILAVLVLTAAVFLYEQYEHEAVQITEYMLPCENLKTEHELKFCVISDLHNNKKRTEDALLETVKAYQPAAFLVCGDMVNKHKTDNSAALHFLTRLTELAPVFYSFGNHESELKENAPDAWEDYVAALPEGVTSWIIRQWSLPWLFLKQKLSLCPVLRSRWSFTGRAPCLRMRQNCRNWQFLISFTKIHTIFCLRTIRSM